MPLPLSLPTHFQESQLASLSSNWMPQTLLPWWHWEWWCFWVICNGEMPPPHNHPDGVGYDNAFEWSATVKCPCPNLLQTIVDCRESWSSTPSIFWMPPPNFLDGIGYNGDAFEWSAFKMPYPQSPPAHCRELQSSFACMFGMPLPWSPWWCWVWGCVVVMCTSSSPLLSITITNRVSFLNALFLIILTCGWTLM